MSPTEIRRQVKEEWSGWDVLLKVGLAMLPFVIPMFAWIVVETVTNREFRNQGTRYTREDHERDEIRVEDRIKNLEGKQSAIYETVIQTDERMKFLLETLRKQP